MRKQDGIWGGQWCLRGSLEFKHRVHEDTLSISLKRHRLVSDSRLTSPVSDFIFFWILFGVHSDVLGVVVVVCWQGGQRGGGNERT